MKLTKQGLVVAFLLFFAISLSSQNTPMPYFCGFEAAEDTIGWEFKKRASSPSNWVIGKAAHRIGEKGLYVSRDRGATASYGETSSGYYIVAYKKFTLAPGSYDLSFDCRVGGEAGGKDAMRVAWMPSTGTPTAGSLGSNFPPYCINNAFVSNAGISLFETIGWSTHTGTITTTATNQSYFLVFVWKTNGGSTVLNPGACLDNIQIAPIVADNACHAKPKNITTRKTATDLVVSWQGNASSYDLMYFNTTSSKNTQYIVIPNIASTSYSIPFSVMPEGVYSFRVKSNCASDTSMWVGISDVLHYDPSAHCLDYLNFKDRSVTTTVGVFTDPYRTVETRDNGYDSKLSVHTVHFISDEYDIRTGNQLKTVPDGSVASVRLSNWTEKESTSGSITYTYKIDPSVGVLLVNYAAVLQYSSNHPASEQTRITIEIIDAVTGNLLSQCTYADFNSVGVAGGNFGHWNQYNPPPDLLEDATTPILWSNWRPIGINVTDYIGRTVKIRLTLRACSANYHFAYAYFALDCNEGKMEGLTCGEHPDTFEVTEGFNYRWYKEGSPNVVLGTNRKFGIASTDTNTYCVDLINTESANCYFTLKGSALPRYPVAELSHSVKVENCQSVISFLNRSKIITKWDGVERITQEKLERFEWDFGKYGKFTDVIPKSIVIPEEGDTFDIQLRAIMGGGCDSIVRYKIEVPALKNKSININQQICDGAVYRLNGKEYTKAGEYTDTVKISSTGCDSVLHIKLDILKLDSVITSDTICSYSPIDFFGETITTSGVYTKTLLSKLGCDSIYNEKTVLVNEVLEIDFDTRIFAICADEQDKKMAYRVNKGIATEYQIVYDSKAQLAGFANTERLGIGVNDTAKIFLPANIRPDSYHAEVIFYNSDCGDKRMPIDFEVYYPSSILSQRWNDVIGLQNENYNGGYYFNNYQWYKNGNVIDGETNPILYLPNDMDFSAEYKLLITRVDDGYKTFTCPIIPTKFDAEDIRNHPVVVFSERTINVSSSDHAIATLHNVQGVKIGTFDIEKGINEIDISLKAGIYILTIVYENGMVESVKIVIT